MTRDEAIKFAKSAAENSPELYTKVEDFQPHEWVLQAITDAFKQGYDEGYDDGYDNGESDAERGCDCGV